MKKYLLVLSVLFVSLYAVAQDDKPKDEETEKKKFAEHLFAGGTLNLGLSSYQFTIGAAPTIGYAFNRWADAGILFNFNYTSFRDYQFQGDKMRQTVYGPGVFARLYPFPFLFAQAQLEHNFIHQKYIYPSGSGLPSITGNLDDNSFLVGGGYTSGRTKDNHTAFYFVSVMFDVSKNVNSPYVDGYGRSLPIINAGIVVPLTRSNSYENIPSRRKGGNY